LNLLYGGVDPTIECYDLVGNYPFRDELSSRDIDHPYITNKCTFKQSIEGCLNQVDPVFLEPISSDRDPFLPDYSVIGPWDNIVSLGIGEDFFLCSLFIN